MSRKSTKENKNVYQLAREELFSSRVSASDASNDRLTEKKLERIESDECLPNPEDVVAMAETFNKPELCNYYCTKECPIGQKYVPEVETIHNLPQITMELLSNLNSLNRDKERIIDITADGVISEDEKEDFDLFRDHLAEMSMAIETLKLWADKKLP